MQKQLKEAVVYEPNKNIRVTVTNQPKVMKETGEVLTEQILTLKVKNGFHDSKLTFSSSDELAEFFANLDFDEEQQSLAL